MIPECRLDHVELSGSFLEHYCRLTAHAGPGQRRSGAPPREGRRCRWRASVLQTDGVLLQSLMSEPANGAVLPGRARGRTRGIPVDGGVVRQKGEVVLPWSVAPMGSRTVGDCAHLASDVGRSQLQQRLRATLSPAPTTLALNRRQASHAARRS